MAKQKKCLLCGSECEEHSRYGPLDRLVFVKCEICGEYEVTSHALHCLKDGCRKEDLYLLSGVTRRAHENGDIYRIMQDVVYDDDAFNAKVKSIIPKRVNDKLNLLLQYIANKSANPGDIVKIVPSRDYPIVFAKDSNEFLFYQNHLVSIGLLDDSTSTMRSFELVITAKGWESVERLQKPNIESKQAFVAMWFNEGVQETFTKGILPVEEDTGFSMIRVDMKEYNDKVCDRIIAEIKKSRFLIADVTGQRQGVYFEAGYAMGMGLPVIWTCREDDVDNCHFDTRQYNHVVWKTPEELREKLKNRILATIR